MDIKLENQNVGDEVVAQVVHGEIPHEKYDGFNPHTDPKENNGKEGGKENLENEDLMEMLQDEVEKICEEESTTHIEIQEVRTCLMRVMRTKALRDKCNLVTAVFFSVTE